MGVSHLLDTHVLLWLHVDPVRVPEAVRDDLADTSHDLVVSAVSALEIATKTRLGKLDGRPLVDAWDRRTEAIGARPLDVTCEHALHAGRLPWEHQDPFDRLLVAQAALEGMRLVTVDRALAALPGITTLTW